MIGKTPKKALHYKHQVAHSFSHAASTYNTYATVQQECAKELINMLQSWQNQLPDGLILEIGCGTGLITQELVQKFGDRPLEITDISEAMLECCQQNLHLALALSPEQTQRISFKRMDGERVNSNATYAAIISGFVVQWFEHPVQSLQSIIAILQPGGMLFASFPTDRSFPEWKQMCQQIGLPFTANILPNLQSLSEQLTNASVKCVWYEKQICTTYHHAIEFFRSLKLIGAGVSRSNQKLSPTQLKHLIEYWSHQNPDRIQVHYHIAFLIVQRQK